MIKDEDRKILIKYRTQQAKEAILEVEKIIESNLLKVAVNRIYYGMFYSLTALTLKYNFQSSIHLQLIGWFNKTFIKNGLIEPKYGKILKDGFKNRSDGDYVPIIEYSLDDVSDMK